MQVGRRLGKVSTQLEAVNMLRAVRHLYRLSYRELSQRLKIPESLLCRYANGDLLPSRETAANIIKGLAPMLDLPQVIRSLVEVRGNYIDMSRVISNPHILRLYAKRVEERFMGLGINKVLTAATDGIPLSVMAAYVLGAELAVAKQYKDLASEEFYEVSYIIDMPPRRVSLYLPTNALSKGDRVLIVDDIVRSGRTLNALATLVREAKASLAGVSVLISTSGEWVRRIREQGNVEVDVILDLGGIVDKGQLARR